jgi:YD repeat-containing protein
LVRVHDHYDAAGNLLSDGTHSYVDDAENRVTCVLDPYGQCSQGAVQYFYDAQGRRVGKQQGDTMEEYVYDLEGHLVSVHDGSANLLRTELYAGGADIDSETVKKSLPRIVAAISDR